MKFWNGVLGTHDLSFTLGIVSTSHEEQKKIPCTKIKILSPEKVRLQLVLKIGSKIKGVLSYRLSIYLLCGLTLIFKRRSNHDLFAEHEDLGTYHFCFSADVEFLYPPFLLRSSDFFSVLFKVFFSFSKGEVAGRCRSNIPRVVSSRGFVLFGAIVSD